MNSPAFTLLELLIVIAFIGILMAASMPLAMDFTKAQNLSQSAKQVKTDLRSAQNRAVSGIDGKAWGISFSAGGSSYTPFKCALDAACACSGQADLSPKTIASGTFSGAAVIAFDLVNGSVCADGSRLTSGAATVTITAGGAGRNVVVSSGGQIEVQ